MYFSAVPLNFYHEGYNTLKPKLIPTLESCIEGVRLRAMHTAKVLYGHLYLNFRADLGPSLVFYPPVAAIVSVEPIRVGSYTVSLLLDAASSTQIILIVCCSRRCLRIGSIRRFPCWQRMKFLRRSLFPSLCWTRCRPFYPTYKLACADILRSSCLLLPTWTTTTSPTRAPIHSYSPPLYFKVLATLEVLIRISRLSVKTTRVVRAFPMPPFPNGRGIRGPSTTGGHFMMMRH